MTNAMKRHAGAMDDQAGVPLMGRVESVDAGRVLVRVSYDEEGTLSGWLPVAQMGGGGGWSVLCLPEPGQQVFVAPDMGDVSHGVVLGVVHSSANPPGKVTPYGDGAQPQPLTPGEITLMHQSGGSLRLTAGGVVEINGMLKVMGDLLVHGEIRDRDGKRGTVGDLRDFYDQHQHTGVRAGSDTSGPTNKPVP